MSKSWGIRCVIAHCNITTRVHTTHPLTFLTYSSLPALVVLQPSRDTLSKPTHEAELSGRAASIPVADWCHIVKVLFEANVYCMFVSVSNGEVTFILSFLNCSIELWGKCSNLWMFCCSQSLSILLSQVVVLVGSWCRAPAPVSQYPWAEETEDENCRERRNHLFFLVGANESMSESSVFDWCPSRIRATLLYLSRRRARVLLFLRSSLNACLLQLWVLPGSKSWPCQKSEITSRLWNVHSAPCKFWHYIRDVLTNGICGTLLEAESIPDILHFLLQDISCSYCYCKIHWVWLWMIYKQHNNGGNKVSLYPECQSIRWFFV